LFEDGYDSSGEGPPHVIGENPNEYSENPLPSVETTEDIVIAPVEAQPVVIIPDDIMKKMKLDELREELEKWGIRIKMFKRAVRTSTKSYD